jgi:hypothetical protein
MLPREIIAALHGSGAELPARVRRAALQQGKRLVPALCRVFEEDREPRRSTGYGDVHALRLLEALGATEAAPDIVDMLRRADIDEIRYSVGCRTLIAFGGAVLEPVLAAAPGGDDFEAARAEVLSHLGVRDPRILAVLLAYLERDVVLGAVFLAGYGDPAALPALSAALDQALVSEEGLGPTPLVELSAAIATLGGELRPEQRARVALDDRLLRERREEWRRERQLER